MARGSIALLLLAAGSPLHAQRAATPAPEVAQRTDYLSFAQGAIPIRIGGAGAALGANYEHAVRLIDGDMTGFTMVSRAHDDTDTEFIYELPALTTFDRLAVPEVLETPSPSSTFTRLVEVHGSATGPDDGYALLASATLRTHTARGQVTELTIARRTPVRWVKVRLVGGIQMLRPDMFLEFSELIGNGRQEPVQLVDRFGGFWQGRGVRLALRQNGAVVSGCYDGEGRLSGAVSGNILRATGIDVRDSTPSAFILSLASDGQLRGVRSSNHGPFRLMTGESVATLAGMRCPDPERPPIGCNTTIYGVNFDYDSAELRPESAPILEALFRSLQADPSTSIVIEGHTSSDGTNEYNERLSQRRAQAVVTDLVGRGLQDQRLRAMGMGELYPIAGNNDESGRAMNRRVVVKCQ